jgi:hypothetical protein
MIENGTDTERRRILLSFLCSALFTLFRFPGSRALAATPYTFGSLEFDLVQTLRQPDSAKVIGREYLLSASDEADRQKLTALICRDRALVLQHLQHKQNLELRKFIQMRIREDFEDEDIAFVNGWMLARTEARLYALASLT